jgi:hypothetical protein
MLPLHRFDCVLVLESKAAAAYAAPCAGPVFEAASRLIVVKSENASALAPSPRAGILRGRCRTESRR